LGRDSALPDVAKSLLESARIEVAGYAVPAGVDDGLFSMLAGRLLSELEAFEVGRSKSQAVIASPPLMLQVSDNGDGTADFSWRYHHPGDYNLDGEVGVADITPIALNYLQSVTDGNRDNVQRFIDGDLSGEIGVSDVTPIAINFQSNYRVICGIFRSAPASNWTSDEWRANAVFSAVAALTPADPEAAALEVNRSESATDYGFAALAVDMNVAGLTSGTYYFGVRDAGNPPRFASADVFSLSGRDIPEIASVNPSGGIPGTNLEFYADVSAGTPPFTYEWDFGGGAAPNASSEELPLVTLSQTTGSYNASVTVTNAYGSDTYEWVLGVGNAPSIESVTPLTGRPGAIAEFSAVVAGEPPLAYEWRFGDAAGPAVSNEESPSVTLTDSKGEYPASLTVTNEYGVDTFDFSIYVGYPPEITGVTPDIGMATRNGTFEAEVSGDAPLTYDWDFGGGAQPDASAEESPPVTFGPHPGVYNASLTVSNPAGSDTLEFEFEVIPLSGDGYTLIAPVKVNDTFLIDMDGNVANSWTSDYPASFSALLSPDGYLYRQCQLEQSQFGAGGAGRIEKRDWDGNLVWSCEVQGPKHISHHDFTLMPNGNLLVIVWNVYSPEEVIAAGRNPEGVSGGGMWLDSIKEIQPVGTDDANVVWEWKVFDHLVQNFDPAKPNYGNPDDHPELVDFNYDLNAQLELTHFNSVSYNERLDQILISVHAYCEIWIIDHSTTTEEAAGHSGGRYGRGGDLLYRWGNPAAYGADDVASQYLFWQHDAQWVAYDLEGGGNITVFNNQPGLIDGMPYSSAIEMTPATVSEGVYNFAGGVFGPPAPEWEFIPDPPMLLFSQLLSSVQRLPGGNTMICSAFPRKIVEVTKSGTIVWNYDVNVPEGVVSQVFRATRYTPDYPGLARLRQQ
jgi:PKD repeat protein